MNLVTGNIEPEENLSLWASLVKPSALQAGVTGSNPVGDTTMKNNQQNWFNCDFDFNQDTGDL